jgi:hypothetical protein
MSENRRKSSSNPYRTVSASERRARRRARDGGAKPTPTERAAAPELPQELVNEMLLNPTKVVTEEQLRGEYGYVLADIRSMALLAAGLVVLLVVLATLLPR